MEDIPWEIRKKLLDPLRNPGTVISFFVKNPKLAIRLFNLYYMRQPIITFLHVLAWIAPTKSLRTLFHRLRGSRIGKHVHISPFVFMDDAFPELVTIEDWVQIAFGAKIVTHDASYRVIFKDVPAKIAPVRIKKNAMIGTGAIILPGVTIGEQAIIGAGAVVTKDIPPRVVALGVPAKPFCTIEDAKKRFLKEIGTEIRHIPYSRLRLKKKTKRDG